MTDNLKEKTYKEKIDSVLTPEVIERMKKAEEKRFEKVIKSLEDENELFLERVKNWIQEYLDECYSYGE